MIPKKNLIIFGYERLIPAFMQTLINYGLNMFDEVFYVTPPMPGHYYEIIKHQNFKIITWNNRQRVKQYIEGVFSIFRPQFWKELSKGKISLEVIKELGILYFTSNIFIELAEPIINSKLSKGQEVYLLGTWFKTDAFAVARLKRKYPNVKAYSLAHSGEVQKGINKYLFQSFHEYMFENLDKTFFISQNVLQDYLKDTAKIHIKERFSDKITSMYLGSRKVIESLNPDETSDTTVILTCSRIDANKRLDKILSVLNNWHSEKIRWIHIGSGILENKIKEMALSVSQNNKKIDILFLGRIDNEEVIKFYSKTHIDLFINVSESEGLPISIMEAMSYGIPCIATNVGGTSEIVTQETGYLIPKDFQEEELTRVIRNHINLSQEEKKLLRHRAFKMWERNFNAENNSTLLYNSWFRDNTK